MAIAFVRTVGTNNSGSTTATTLSVTVGTAVPGGTGQLLVLRFAAFDFVSGTVSVADSRGNTWQQDFAKITSSDGINVVYSTVVATTLQVGDTITVTFPASDEPYAMAIDQWSGFPASGWRWQVDSAGAKGSSTSPTDTITPGASPPVYSLVVGALFIPASSSDGFTEDTTNTAGGDSWHSLGSAFGTSGTPNQAVRGAYKIPTVGNTGVAQTWAPHMGVSRTWLETLVIYQGATSPVTLHDVPAGTRTGSPRDTVNAAISLPVTLTSDVPAGTRAGSPVGDPTIVAPADVPAGARTGSPVDGPLLIGVTLHDVPEGTRSGSPVDRLAIGVVLTSDSPAGTRTGSPAILVGNTVTTDVSPGIRTGSPLETLEGGGDEPHGPSSLAGDLPNPNRPVVVIRAGLDGGPPLTPGNAVPSLDSRIRQTIVRKWATTRGRQYELDQVQAGTATFDITDPLEYLNPENTLSPLNNGFPWQLKAYRAMRITALWPVTGNLAGGGITDVADPGFEDGGTGGVGTGQWLPLDGAATITNVTDDAFEGTHSLRVVQATSGSGHGAKVNYFAAPDLRLTFSVWVKPAAGTQVAIRVTDGTLATHDSLNVATDSTTWTRLWVQWLSAEIVEQIEIYATGGTKTFHMDAVQFEFSAAPSDFTRDGPKTNVIYTGYIERYPIQYDHQGTRGLRPLTAVDAVAIMSRTQVDQSYSATILADSPALFIPFNDAAAPAVVQRPNGGEPMQGYTQIGSNSASINGGGDSFLDSTPAMYLVQQNADPVTTSDTTMLTVAGTRGGSVSANPLAFTLEMWIRHISGTVYGGAGAMQLGESTIGEVTGTLRGLHVFTTGGRLCFRYRDPNGGDTGLFTLTNFGDYHGVPDGQWHHVVLVLDGGTIYSVVDGVSTVGIPLGFTPSQAVAFDNFNMMATTVFGDPISEVSVANWAAYTRVLPQATIQAHYHRGTGFDGEASGARIGRLLDQYWQGGLAVAPGYLKMAPDYGYSTRMLLDVGQEIQESERGLLYANVRGQVVFDDRSSRYRGTQQVPFCVFGEDVAAGEIPYEDYEGDVDPTYVFSQANLTRPGNNAFAPMINQQAKTDYGQRILSHEEQSRTDFDLTEAGRFYLARYANPKLRIEKLSFNPAAYPAAWATLLGLELGTRVTVKRRSPTLTTSHDYYVEQINHTTDANDKTRPWVVELQLSPVFVPVAWVLGDATYGVLGSTTTPIY